MFARSEPAPGSVMAMPRIISPEIVRGRYFAFCSALAVALQVGHADVGVEREHQPVRADPGELLHQDRVVQEVAARAAVLLGRVRAEEALLAAAPPGLAVRHAGRVPAGHLGRDLRLGEAAELGPEQLVLLAEDLPSHGRSSWRWAL